MMNRFSWTVVALASTVGFLLGLVGSSTGSRPSGSDAGLRGHQDRAPLVLSAGASAGPSGSGGVDFAAVAAKVNPAVVNVDAAVRSDARARTGLRWRRDFSEGADAPREGSGSGFLIDSSGYLLTNFHVVDGADRLTITLSDGRSFKAEVVGIDPAIDVALLKIPSAGQLPFVTLGDSDELRPGQWVCAIGNPLGYVHSVTVGVVSFLGRKLFDQSLDAYIQTDAAISLGNSGGPLIDGRGRVVGITTAVSSQAANIGFAIPIGQVVPILPQLRDPGRVARGYIGVGLTQVTPALRRALGLTVDRGALVQEVPTDTPADRAGLRTYDVIVSADDLAIRSDEELIRYISGRVPGTAARLGVVRQAERRTVHVKLAERPVPETARRRTEQATDARPASGREQGPLGLTVRDLDRATAMRQALPDTVQGVIVVDVDPAGPARLARLRPGHVILEINRRRVESAEAFQALMAALKPGDVVAALIYDKVTDQRVLVTIVSDPAS